MAPEGRGDCQGLLVSDPLGPHLAGLSLLQGRHGSRGVGASVPPLAGQGERREGPHLAPKGPFDPFNWCRSANQGLGLIGRHSPIQGKMVSFDIQGDLWLSVTFSKQLLPFCREALI